ncbi:MAG: multicopper oxidase domain-containing protein, partial [Chloroflexota bacterium]
MLTRNLLNASLSVIVVFSLMFGTTVQVNAQREPMQPAAAETQAMPMNPVDESKVPHYYGPYPNWANSPQVVQDATVAINPAAPVPVSVGNALSVRANATDLENLFVLNTSAALPNGTLTAFETWAQGAAGPLTFNAYVLRPTGTLDQYTVIFDSGALTVPDAASGLQTFTLPTPVAVQSGDLLAFYGQGIPSDIGAGVDTALTGIPAPALNQTFTVGTEYTLVSADRTYSFAATVTPVSVDPGTGATAVATIDPKTGSISAITVTSPGTGYLVAPDVVISSLNGTGATAAATISLGALTEIVVDLPGFGFTNPSVSITGGNPSTPAIAVASGVVDDLFLTAAGAGYVQPIVEFGLPDYGTDQATGAVTWDSATGAITSITIVNPGSGYASAPVVNIWDGSTGQGPTGIDGVASEPAAAGATIGISAISLTDAGAGYDSAPIITITDAGGLDKGADAHAVLAVRGAVTDITVTNGGSGYLTPGLKKFTDALPGLCAPPNCPADSAAQYIPLGVPDTTTYPGSDYYEIAVVQYRHQYSSQLPPALARGYVQLETPVNASISQHYPLVNELLDGTSVPVTLNGQQVYAVTPPKYLGPTLVTAEGWPVRILFRNLLPTGIAGDLFLPVDTSMMGSGEGPDTMMLNPDGTPMDMVMDQSSVMDGVRNQMCGETPKPTDASGKIECYTENRATLHLHGGITPWISDGTPHQWTTPASENALYPEGVSVSNVPDMPDPGPGALTFFYTNQQSARLMFYHDHAWGITRLNVYAGEAAGYLITDDTEASLVSRNLIPGAADTVPLIIQDRTFVPTADKMAELDPTWDASRWGGYGNVWMPHVYMPAQNPSDPSGMSGFGRWMYGPYFWPPVDAKYPPIPNPYFGKDPEGPDGIRHTADDWSSNLAIPCNLDDPATWQYDTDPFCEPSLIPGTPNNSAGMEAFHDTPVVNGVAYPTVTFDPKAYRLRILNAANDRFWNLSLYVADPRTGTLSEVALNPAELEAAQTDPVVFPTPDETWSPKGPNWIQIGTEGGFLPSPTVIPAHPTTWITDPTRFDVGLVDQHSLLLGPAERADVIVDFSQFRGKTLILYNDAPAAFPARVPSYDYYTGNPDLSPAGAPSTLPGYGPNTRTIMQIKVSNAAPAVAFDRPNTSNDRLGQLVSAFGHQPDGSGVFESGQNPIIVGQAVYNNAYGTNFAAGGWCSAPANPSAKCDGYARISEQGGDLFKFDTLAGPQLSIPLEPKGIHDEMNSANFDPWGRMAGNLGLEAPGATPLLQNIILYPYVNPATEILSSTGLPSSLNVTPISSASDGTQIWKITHNGVDTHPIHFHLYDVQVLNRVAWDNIISPPDPNEIGWKDTVRINPLQDTYVAVRPIVPEIPFGIPDSVRPLNPMMPIGARGTQNGQNGWRGTEAGFNNTNANGQAIAPIINEIVNFKWEYVWHCHILNHEEMDMMRPVSVTVTTTLAAAPALSISGNAGEPITLSWTDGTAIDYNSPATWDVTNSEIGFRVERSANGGAYAPIGNALANMTSFTDNTTTAGNQYRYLVVAYNAAGESASNVVKTPPSVISSVRQNSNPSNRSTVFFLVTFSDPMTGVDVTDFALTADGITGASVASVTGTGATRSVGVLTGTGDGTIRLDVVDNDTILDDLGNPLGGPGIANGDFTGGQSYSIDRTPPAVVSSVRLNADPSNRATVFFSVTFSESVIGVNTADFALTASGVTGASVTGVTGTGATRTVAVNTGTGSGTIRLDVVDDDSIRDAANNSLGGPGAGNGNFTGGQSYTMDKTPPTVVSSV